MIRRAISLFFFACAALCAFAYYDRYYKWRDCFNELGRCFDPETASVYLEQSGIAWALFFIILIIPALILWFKKPKS
ncbi:hypothetical protein [Amylibacter sp. IMCC11727]|uniref:hypothetical protein n=1 Tax=Amylibacter sp. IMCC11727 TaxID=3039851 RepID=UPI00244DDFA4|nr:hypothetical protein [Amylibacter sp. IMCC11727]WGI21834.1 hypothetical protein QBD29_17260 [Amylibacter sp. IMCC11727]